MKYCSHCGAEIMDEAVVCPHCGCAVDTKKKSNHGLQTAAKILMIISCCSCALSALYSAFFGNAIFSIMLQYGGVEAESVEVIAGSIGIISAIVTLIPLAWMIPMTISYSRKVKNREALTTAFKVCTLIFVNIIAGILMLADNNN